MCLCVCVPGVSLLTLHHMLRGRAGVEGTAVKCWELYTSSRYTSLPHTRRDRDMWVTGAGATHMHAFSRVRCRTIPGACSLFASHCHFHMREKSQSRQETCARHFYSHDAPLELFQRRRAAGMWREVHGRARAKAAQIACRSGANRRRCADASPPLQAHANAFIHIHTSHLSFPAEDGIQACDACSEAAMSAEPLSSLYWPPDVARYNMEAVLHSSSGWLRTACIVFALFWYVHG